VEASKSRGVTFHGEQGAFLSQSYIRGETERALTWVTKPDSGPAKLWLIGEDEGNGHTFTYDGDGRMLTHQRSTGTESWTYPTVAQAKAEGDPEPGESERSKAFFWTPTGYTDALNRKFSIKTTLNYQAIGNSDGFIATCFSPSGAPTRRRNLSGHLSGPGKTRNYLPMGDGYRSSNDNLTHIPFTGPTLEPTGIETILGDNLQAALTLSGKAKGTSS